MTAPPKTDAQLITDAIGAHGIFFKKALRSRLETISGARVIGEEYPVRYLEGGAVDLLVEYASATATFVLPIECKRALATVKKWIFFRDSLPDVKLIYSFKGAALNVLRSRLIPLARNICIEGVEVDLSKLRGDRKSPYNAASTDRIWEAAQQACKGAHGFIQDELQARKQVGTPRDTQVFPLIVTTADLQIAGLPPGSVELGTGAHVDDLEVTDVPWLVLNHPFTPPSTLGSQHLQVNVSEYADPIRRSELSKEGIVVVNAQHVERFFDCLGSGKTV